VTDKPIPKWAFEAAKSATDPVLVQLAYGDGHAMDEAEMADASGALDTTTESFARLLVSTREAALREAATRVGGDSWIEAEILESICCEPWTWKCAMCGSDRSWPIGLGQRYGHADSCPHYVAPPTPPPEIPWVRIS
jgi:hypothetical protein